MVQVVKTLRKFRGGWPGGWAHLRQGWSTGPRQEPFHSAHDEADPRARLPVLGLREYWYPCCPESSVQAGRPTGVRILGEDLVLFKDSTGEVRALRDRCPHRGAKLSMGDCFWKGYLSCGYHGATFDGSGQCVEFISEGPASKMVGIEAMHVRSFPTYTKRGVVFVWMGDRQPVPISEDLPPEILDDAAFVRFAWRYWSCNWLVALENTLDAHNQMYVHRNSLRFAFTYYGGRKRTPVGPRPRVVDGKTVDAVRNNTEYYATEDGRVPVQMHYPRADAYWPRNSLRNLTGWIFERADARAKGRPSFSMAPEWLGQRLPGMVRHQHRGPFRATMYTRWCIPVEDNLTRVFYVYGARPSSAGTRMLERLLWPAYNWIVHFNFSDQDYDAMQSVRYDTPEHLSATDSILIALRKLILEHGRDFTTASAASGEGGSGRACSDPASVERSATVGGA